MNDYSDLLERLGRAATRVRGNKGPKRRLLHAAFEDVVPLRTADFPPEHQADWNALMQAMLRVPDPKNGAAYASIEAMDDDEVQRWCDVIVRIHADILRNPRR